MAKPLSEAHIERQITDFLGLDGWRALKTDPCSDKSRGKGFGAIGMADVLYIRYRDPAVNIRSFPSVLPLTVPEISSSQVMWVEHKRRGGRVSMEQKTWHRAERARGALVVVATEDFAPSLEGFQNWYRFNGLVRRLGLL